MDSKDEYLMLREEILHHDSIENNTINFMYVFVSAILTISLNQEDALYVLIAYIVTIPAYRIVWSKRKGICKIGAYLNVFLEGKEYNWERRSCKMYDNPPNWVSSKIQSFNFPFLFVSTFVLIVFLTKIKWDKLENTIEFIRLLIGVLLYGVQISMILSHRKISSEDFIPIWKDVKDKE